MLGQGSMALLIDMQLGIASPGFDNREVLVSSHLLKDAKQVGTIEASSPSLFPTCVCAREPKCFIADVPEKLLPELPLGSSCHQEKFCLGNQHTSNFQSTTGCSKLKSRRKLENCPAKTFT